MSDYLKDKLGYEDVHFDTSGNDSTFARATSTGGSQTIKKINASDLPLILATRTLTLYNSGVLSATEVDTALTQICASLASIHKFSNETELDLIVSAGSGAIISVSERAKLNQLLDIGSGRIISDSERSKLSSIAALTEEQLNTLSNLNSIIDGLHLPQIAIIKDVKASGTDAGASLTRDTLTRDLNTLEDPDSIVTTLSANAFTLAAGKYFIRVEAPCYNTQNSYAYLEDNEGTQYMGHNAFGSLGDFACISVVITIAESKTYTVKQWTHQLQANSGLGNPKTISGVSEIYTIVEIHKL